MANQTDSQVQSLKDFVCAEARRIFDRTESPRYPFPLSDAIDCLFELLQHKLGDPGLDAVGSQILHALASYRDRNDFLNLPDRMEAFLKFIQRLLKSSAAVVPRADAPSRERMFLPEVLQAFGLANASTVGNQPLADLEGKPRFAWYIEKAVRARNEVHRAPAYLAREKAEIFESVCVVMIFAVCELKDKIGLALLASTQRGLLERYRDNFDKWRERFVDVEGQERPTDEFEGIDPLAVEMLDETGLAQDEGDDDEDSAEDLQPHLQHPEQRRGLVRDLIRTIPKLVLLGDPGAGKTTTLQYLAWQMASGLLKNPAGEWLFPVYLPLKTFASLDTHTIEAAIQSETGNISLKQLAKQRCILLLDGLNEVPQEHVLVAKHQIQSMLSLGDNLRVVMTCRPGQFQNEFGVPVFELQPLKDEQIRQFFQRHLRDPDKVRKLMAVIKRQPKLWEWARNPFMLAMLVRVFLKNGKLPENRGNLMRDFLGDIMRRERAQGAARIPLETKTTLLARLAFETRKLALLSFTRLQACAWLKQRRDELGSTLDVPLFVEELVNNNLIAKTGGDLLTFDHELYQEYFCATALLEMGDEAIALIKELQQEPRWEEPIIFYSGICECRSSLLQTLAAVNVRLAAKSLTSAAVDETADRKVILNKAKELAAEATDHAQVAEGLLSLAELGEAEAMIAVLKQRGAQDATARQAIQSFIPKCPTDLVVGWIQRTSDLSDKFLITWMLAAVAADQKESLLRDHREALKDLVLWQAKRVWQRTKKGERSYMKLLLAFVGPEFQLWLGRSLIKDILARVDYGGDDQWVALKCLGQTECELCSSANQHALFITALNCCRAASIAFAASFWSHHLAGQDLSFVFRTLHDEKIRRILRLLRQIRSATYYRLSIALAETLRSHHADLLSKNPHMLKTSTARVEFLINLRVGQICKNCRIMRFTDFGAFVELEPGQDALLHNSDMNWDSAATESLTLEVNQQVDVVVLEISDATGKVLVGLKQILFYQWAELLGTLEEGGIYNGKVKKKVKGGLIMDIGVLAFLPTSQIDIVPPGDLDGFLNETLKVKVIKVDHVRFGVVVSRRELIEQERSERRQKLLEELKVGEVRAGTVKRIVDFGAFVDLNGIDCLLHVTDLSWGQQKRPSEVLKVGEKIDVMILDINREKNRVSVGRKQMQRNPWDDVALKFKVGDKIHGKVVRVVPYGAFVEIEEGIEGMVHVSELSWTKKVVRASEVLKAGDEIDAVVLDIKRDEQKIALGTRQLEVNPWTSAPKKYAVGMRVLGKVCSITSFGAFVEVEPGIQGMVHVSDMSWTHSVNHPSEMLKKDDVVEAVVLAVDASNQRMALGIKQLVPDPWQEVAKRYRIGDKVNGKVVRLISFGAFVQLPDQIEGLVHISQVGEAQIDRGEAVLQVGDEVTASVIKIDATERSITLSLKADQAVS